MSKFAEMVARESVMNFPYTMTSLKHMDVSQDFSLNAYDQEVALELLRLEGTPEAIQHFARRCNKLTDYGYWYMLGTLWVSYSGWSDLNLWKRLFKERRPRRKTSLMKPSEVCVFEQLPDVLTVYRAHRFGEKDWISYTLNPETAKRFARERGVPEFVEYEVDKHHVKALFLRREEDEVLVLERSKAKRIAIHKL